MLQRCIATAIPSVCQSYRQSHVGVVTEQNKPRSPSDSSIILVFGDIRLIWKFGQNHPRASLSDVIKSGWRNYGRALR